MEKIYNSTCENDTVMIAQSFATSLQPLDVVCLHGTLGAGKSVFARAIIRALVNNQNLNVPSPTFNIAQSYDAPEYSIWHFDFYRLEEEEEIFEIGWEDALAGNVVLIEWAEKIPSFIPQKRIDVFIDHTENGRAIKIIGQQL